MQLVFTNPENTMLMARLEQGESITNFHGPTIIHIPVDPANTQYADIVKRELKIDKYVAPPPAPTFAVPQVTVNQLEGKIQALEVRLAAIETRLPALSEQHHTH
jgi:hypothetical protein